MLQHPGSRFANKKNSGLTLIEMLVALVIVSILASAALPFAEMTLKRNKELELKRSLRTIRNAIDLFHEDWRAGKISKLSGMASDDGYPVSLSTLVYGVDFLGPKGGKRYYLRRIPKNPFSKTVDSPEQQWTLRSYQDEPDNAIWGGQDVYDVRANYQGLALDGSRIDEW